MPLFKACWGSIGLVSTPMLLPPSSYLTPDSDQFKTRLEVGAVAADAPVRQGGNPSWLLAQLSHQFSGVYFHHGCAAEVDNNTLAALSALQRGRIPIRIILLRIDRHPSPVPVAEHADSPPPNLDGFLFLDASDHLVAQRYDAIDGSFYLIRPDQHVCARWRQVNLALIEQALLRACGINHSV